MFPGSSPRTPPRTSRRHPCGRSSAQLRPRPREKGVCLPGNPSPCNRVSRDTARDALTSALRAQARPPAPLAGWLDGWMAGWLAWRRAEQTGAGAVFCSPAG